MRRIHAVRWGAVLLLGAACAHAPRPSTGGATRVIPLGQGLALPAGEMLLALPTDQRYRFVAVDSIVRGATSEDAASVRETSGLRTAMSVVLESRGWRASADSADFDLLIFISRRTGMRTEVREEPVISSPTSNLPRCDLSRGANQPPCTNEPNPRTRSVRVSVPYSVANIHHIIRRRSDGAVRHWVHPANGLADARALVARDLLRILLTPEG